MIPDTQSLGRGIREAGFKYLNIAYAVLPESDHSRLDALKWEFLKDSASFHVLQKKEDEVIFSFMWIGTDLLKRGKLDHSKQTEFSAFLTELGPALKNRNALYSAYALESLLDGLTPLFPEDSEDGKSLRRAHDTTVQIIKFMNKISQSTSPSAPRP